MTTEYMTHKHLKVGDRVLLKDRTNPRNNDIEAGVRKVGKGFAETDGFWLVDDQFGAILVERDGKRVKSIVKATGSGNLMVEYVGDTYELYRTGVGGGWEPSRATSTTNEWRAGNGGWTYIYRAAEAVEAEGFTDEQIDAALQRVKDNNGLCVGFDKIVDEARQVPTYMERLKRTAFKHPSKNRREDGPTLYGQLLTELTPKPKVEVPEVGRWIRATTKDGEVHEFEVTSNTVRAGLEPYVEVAPHVKRDGHYVLYTEAPDENRWDVAPLDRRIVEWVYLAKPPRKIKWPSGTFVQRTDGPKNVRTVVEDHYEGDKEVDLEGHGRVYAHHYQRVEITVVP